MAIFQTTLVFVVLLFVQHSWSAPAACLTEFGGYDEIGCGDVDEVCGNRCDIGNDNDFDKCCGDCGNGGLDFGYDGEYGGGCVGICKGSGGYNGDCRNFDDGYYEGCGYGENGGGWGGGCNSICEGNGGYDGYGGNCDDECFEGCGYGENGGGWGGGCNSICKGNGGYDGYGGNCDDECFEGFGYSGNGGGWGSGCNSICEGYGGYDGYGGNCDDECFEGFGYSGNGGGWGGGCNSICEGNGGCNSYSGNFDDGYFYGGNGGLGGGYGGGYGRGCGDCCGGYGGYDGGYGGYGGGGYGGYGGGNGGYGCESSECRDNNEYCSSCDTDYYRNDQNHFGNNGAASEQALCGQSAGYNSGCNGNSNVGRYNNGQRYMNGLNNDRERRDFLDRNDNHCYTNIDSYEDYCTCDEVSTSSCSSSGTKSYIERSSADESCMEAASCECTDFDYCMDQGFNEENCYVQEMEDCYASEATENEYQLYEACAESVQEESINEQQCDSSSLSCAEDYDCAQNSGCCSIY